MAQERRLLTPRTATHVTILADEEVRGLCGHVVTMRAVEAAVAIVAQAYRRDDVFVLTVVLDVVIIAAVLNAAVVQTSARGTTVTDSEHRGAPGSMLIVMALMGGVSLPVMQVVDMIAMRHRGVSAAMLVPVLVAPDRHVLRDLAFCPLPLPLTVHVTVVGVVDVVSVLESHVSTAFAVLVAVVVVDLLGGGHRYPAVVRGARSLPGAESSGSGRLTSSPDGDDRRPQLSSIMSWCASVAIPECRWRDLLGPDEGGALTRRAANHPSQTPFHTPATAVGLTPVWGRRSWNETRPVQRQPRRYRA